MSELEHLRSANESIRRFVEHAGRDTEVSIGTALEDLRRISERLAKVGEMLSDGSLPRNRSDDIDAELQDYRANIEGLHARVAVMEERLRSEREILLQKRRHLSALGRWAASAKDID